MEENIMEGKTGKHTQGKESTDCNQKKHMNL